jgi:hypothetical protein
MESPRVCAERLLLAAVLACTFASTHGALYKWVDEKGRVQYSDKPPIDKGKGGVEMSNRGVVVKRLEGGLTPEQTKAKEEEELRKKADEHKAQEQKRQDAALLQSFTNAQEIDMKRDRELQSLDAVIGNLRGQERSVNERMVEERRRAEFYDKRKKPPPDSIKDDLARSENEKKVIAEEIVRRQQEITATRSKYEALKKRYLELRQQDQASIAAPTTAAPQPPAKK